MRIRNYENPLLSVNREARVEVQKFRNVNMSLSSEHLLWINPEIDVLFPRNVSMDRSDLEYLWVNLYGLSEFSEYGRFLCTMRDLSKLKHLMLNYRVYK